VPFPLNDHTRRSIRDHFRRTNLEWTEDYFLDVLEKFKRKHDIYWAVLALRDCGTARSIPFLSAKLHYPMQDVKCTSILTIAHIAGAAETELYAHALLDPTYREKGYAMWAIRDAADSRAVDAVVSYFRKNMSKIRKGKLHNATLPDGLDYLQQYADTDHRVTALFADIMECWACLAEGERKTIAERVPYFRHLEGGSGPAA
jgi:hypothetical protein